MNLHKDKYIIVEVIPTSRNPENGFIVQLSALKLDGIKLLDRFDYRVKDELIENDDLKELISYNKEMFTYVDNIYFIIEKFKRWAEDYPILIFEDDYTPKYLSELNNKKESIYPYIDMEYSLDVFNKIMDKYKIEPTDHLVDILYEAIIFHGEKKED